MARKGPLWLRGLKLLPSLVPFILIGVVAFTLYRQDRESTERWREERRAQAAAAADRRQRFAAGDLAETLRICRLAWVEELSAYSDPAALAWTRNGLDGYFYSGVDAASWLRLRCDADGVRADQRFERPFIDQMPAEARPAVEATTEGAFQRALGRLVETPLAAGELAVELTTDPVTGAALVRRWRGVEAGARPVLEPPEATPFPMLVAEPSFPLAPGTAPPPLTPLPRYRWADDSDRAFEVIARALPRGATIVELTLTDDAIEVSIDHPTPAFDGAPPLPYGDLDFDPYGVADRDWWYPREIPGFGCPHGRPLAEVAASLATAKAKAGKPPLARAWYTCSPTYSNGTDGVWNLLAR